MNAHTVRRHASLVAVAGATLQIIYGLLACVFPYPTITDRPFEVLWALANIGMIASIVAWLMMDVARPRWVAALGGGAAILGHLIRIGVSAVIEVRPHASVDAAIVGSIGFMFIGIAILGAATLRRKQLPGWNAWAPLLVLLAGLIAAPFYSIDKVVHFILLGLLWGTAWLFMASVGYRQQRRTTAGAAAPVPSAASAG